MRLCAGKMSTGGTKTISWLGIARPENQQRAMGITRKETSMKRSSMISDMMKGNIVTKINVTNISRTLCSIANWTRRMITGQGGRRPDQLHLPSSQHHPTHIYSLHPFLLGDWRSSSASRRCHPSSRRAPAGGRQRMWVPAPGALPWPTGE
eukprot:767548-Hanusia_phi.AAC.7